MFTIIVRRLDGAEIKLVPGGKSELQFIEDIKQRAKEHGVGFLKTEAKVLAAIGQAVEEAFLSLKSDILP